MPKLVRSNVQIVQIHANADSSTAQPQNLENSNEIPPTYEDAMQLSSQTENRDT